MCGIVYHVLRFAVSPDAVSPLVVLPFAIQLGVSEASVGGDVLRCLYSEERNIPSQPGPVDVTPVTTRWATILMRYCRSSLRVSCAGQIVVSSMKAVELRPGGLDGSGCRSGEAQGPYNS